MGDRSTLNENVKVNPFITCEITVYVLLGGGLFFFFFSKNKKCDFQSLITTNYKKIA